MINSPNSSLSNNNSTNPAPKRNKRAEQERLRRQRKAQGLIHIKGWVSPQQAEAIQAIMSNNPVQYQPLDEANVTQNNHQIPLSAKTSKNPPKLRYRKKTDHPDAWTVWAGRVELGTVYKHIIDEDPRPVTVWMAYRQGQRNRSRHETRQRAAEALLKEYKGSF